MIQARYKCLRCGLEWSGYRILYHECVTVNIFGKVCPMPCPLEGKPSGPLPGYGMTACPRCAHLYVDWINYKKCTGVR